MEVPIVEAARPLDPTQFIVPPDWAVRLVSTNFGKRGQKYPMGWTQHERYFPGGGAYSPTGQPWGMPGPYDYDAQWERLEGGSDAPVRGNLKEDAYRFWNGSGHGNSNIAVCRWCRHYAYSEKEMQAHQDKTNHTRILRCIYDFARGREHMTKLCFTCGARTARQHWGIPMCAANKCRNKWRIAPIGDVSSTLLLYAKFARNRGLLKEWINEDGSEKNNLEANPRPFDWDRARIYP